MLIWMRVDGLLAKMNEPANELWSLWGNPTMYTEQVRAYLAWQQRLFDDILLSGCYTSVIEAGCGDGSFLMSTTVERDIHYFGVDIEPNAIDALKRRIATLTTRCERVEAILGDIHNLEQLVIQHRLPAKNVLVALPFNAFGNLENPLSALRAIASHAYDVLIFSYRTDKPTQRIRETYYKNIGFHNLETSEDALGVFFTDSGWKSYAYHPPLVIEWLNKVGFSSIQQTDFADFGTACYAVLPQHG